MVVQEVANDATSAGYTDRDANAQPWPAEPAPVRLSTAASSVARSATADGQVGESADSNACVQLTDGRRASISNSRSLRVHNANRLAGTIRTT